MVVGGSSPASDVVITVEPARAESRSWSGEARAAVRNNGARLRGWIAEEAVWMLAQFTKVALSVFVVRGVAKLFQVGAASQRAYVRADLWTHGQDERVYTASNGAAWRPAGSGSGGQRENRDLRTRTHPRAVTCRSSSRGYLRPCVTEMTLLAVVRALDPESDFYTVRLA